VGKKNVREIVVSSKVLIFFKRKGREKVFAGMNSLKKSRGNYYLTIGSQSYQGLLKK